MLKSCPEYPCKRTVAINGNTKTRTKQMTFDTTICYDEFVTNSNFMNSNVFNTPTLMNCFGVTKAY